ncbi:MAG: hypothetical protein WKF75_08720 [Singulisphaera sp.]
MAALERLWSEQLVNNPQNQVLASRRTCSSGLRGDPLLQFERRSR